MGAPRLVAYFAGFVCEIAFMILKDPNGWDSRQRVAAAGGDRELAEVMA